MRRESQGLVGQIGFVLRHRPSGLPNWLCLTRQPLVLLYHGGHRREHGGLGEALRPPQHLVATTSAGDRPSIRRRFPTPVCYAKIQNIAEILRRCTSPALSFPRRREPRSSRQQAKEGPPIPLARRRGEGRIEPLSYSASLRLCARHDFPVSGGTPEPSTETAIAEKNERMRKKREQPSGVVLLLALSLLSAMTELGRIAFDGLSRLALTPASLLPATDHRLPPTVNRYPTADERR